MRQNTFSTKKSRRQSVNWSKFDQMKELRFKHERRKAAQRDVERAERRLGAFPGEYRQVLIASNGGLVDDRNSFFPFKDKEARCAFGSGFLVEKFFPAKDADCPDEELVNVADVYQGRVPTDTLPIARNAFGDLVLLGMRGPSAGRVYVWDHEREGSANPRPFRNVYLVASTFSQFVDELRAPPPLPPASYALMG